MPVLDLRIVSLDDPMVKLIDATGANPATAIGYDYPGVAAVGLREGMPAGYISFRFEDERAIHHHFAYVPRHPERCGLLSLRDLKAIGDWLVVYLWRMGFKEMIIAIDKAMKEAPIHRRVARWWGATKYAENDTREWWVAYTPAAYRSNDAAA